MMFVLLLLVLQIAVTPSLASSCSSTVSSTMSLDADVMLGVGFALNVVPFMNVTHPSAVVNVSFVAADGSQVLRFCEPSSWIQSSSSILVHSARMEAASSIVLESGFPRAVAVSDSGFVILALCGTFANNGVGTPVSFIDNNFLCISNASATVRLGPFVVRSGPAVAWALLQNNSDSSNGSPWKVTPVMATRVGIPLPSIVLSAQDQWQNPAYLAQDDDSDIYATLVTTRGGRRRKNAFDGTSVLRVSHVTRTVASSTVTFTNPPLSDDMMPGGTYQLSLYVRSSMTTDVQQPMVVRDCCVVYVAHQAGPPVSLHVSLPSDTNLTMVAGSRESQSSATNSSSSGGEVVSLSGPCNQMWTVILQALDEWQNATELYENTSVAFSSKSYHMECTALSPDGRVALPNVVMAQRWNSTASMVRFIPPESWRRSSYVDGSDGGGWLDCALVVDTAGVVLLQTVAVATCSPEVPTPVANCVSLDPSAVLLSLPLSSATWEMLNEIPLWYQANGNGFPVVVLEWTLPSDGGWMPSVGWHWTLLPNPRFRSIPMDLLASFTFGASYAKVGRITAELSQPICWDSNATDANWVRRVGVLLGLLIDNVTAASRSAYASIDNIDTPVAPCFATSRNADLIGLWSSTCLYRVPSSDSVLSSGIGITSSTVMFEEDSGPTVGALALAIVGALVAFGCGGGLLWYAWYVVRQLDNKVRLANRHSLPLAMKCRIVLAHVLAPFIIVAHAYTIYPFRTLNAGIVLYSLDIAIAAEFFGVTVIRLVAPTAKCTTPLYLFSSMLLLFYTSSLLGLATLWGLAALSIDVRIIPYATAGALMLLQCAWQIKMCSDELMPSVSLLSRLASEQSRQETDVVRSTAPLTNALSLEMFCITMLLFMFAVTQVQDITPFMAVISAFVMVAYSFLANYSVSRKLELAFSSLFPGAIRNGDDDLNRSMHGGSDGDSFTLNMTRLRDDNSPQALIARLLAGAGVGTANPLSVELSRLSQHLTSNSMGGNDITNNSMVASLVAPMNSINANDPPCGGVATAREPVQQDSQEDHLPPGTGVSSVSVSRNAASVPHRRNQQQKLRFSSSDDDEGGNSNGEHTKKAQRASRL